MSVLAEIAAEAGPSLAPYAVERPGPRRFEAGLREAAGDVPVQVCHTTGLLTVFFSEEPVRDYEDAKRCDTERYAAFCRAMLDRGVYLPPSQFEAWFPSLAHTPEHVERTADAAAAAFDEVR